MSRPLWSLERSSDKYITPNKLLIASVIVAALGLVVDLVLDWATAWMPNVVVGALTVGLTVTVIDKAMRRAESLRQQPRVDAALRGMNIALRSFLRSAVNGLPVVMEQERTLSRFREAA